LSFPATVVDFIFLLLCFCLMMTGEYLHDTQRKSLSTQKKKKKQDNTLASQGQYFQVR